MADPVTIAGVTMIGAAVAGAAATLFSGGGKKSASEAAATGAKSMSTAPIAPPHTARLRTPISLQSTSRAPNPPHALPNDAVLKAATERISKLEDDVRLTANKVVEATELALRVKTEAAAALKAARADAENQAKKHSANMTEAAAEAAKLAQSALEDLQNVQEKALNTAREELRTALNTENRVRMSIYVDTVRELENFTNAMMDAYKALTENNEAMASEAITRAEEAKKKAETAGITQAQLEKALLEKQTGTYSRKRILYLCFPGLHP